MAAKNKSNEIVLIRLFDAPLKAVWEAWTDPKQVAQWWGPRGFTITTHDHDLRTGGSWAYTMHGPDGVDYPNTTKYLEVKKHSLLIYDHGGHDDQPPLFRVTARFSESNSKTKLHMTMTLATPEAAEETRRFIKKAGGDSTWDRLAEYLEKQSSGKEKFVINRSFDVPIATMFKAWTDPQHIAKWLPPIGCEMQFIRADVRPGGSGFYCMTSPGGKMYGRLQYLEIHEPDRVVYTQQFCDENENVARHPLSPTWPENMLTVVTFSEEGESRTRVTITWTPEGQVTAEELATFVKGKAGMTQGWTGSLDKLEAYLEHTSPDVG